MKKLTIPLTLLLSLNVVAKENLLPIPCELQSRIAVSVMTSRQDGVSLMRAMELSKGHAIIKAYAMIAYESPVERSAARKQSAINKFRDDVELICMKHKVN